MLSNPNMDNIKRSIKPVKELQACYVRPLYIFPAELANGRDRETRKPAVVCGINAENWSFPLDTPVELPDRVWLLMQNVGFIDTSKVKIIYPPTPNNSFDPIKEFNPLKDV